MQGSFLTERQSAIPAIKEAKAPDRSCNPAVSVEAFDEPWKGSEKEDEPEKHWGIFNEDRSPKEAVKVLEG